MVQIITFPFIFFSLPPSLPAPFPSLSFLIPLLPISLLPHLNLLESHDLSVNEISCPVNDTELALAYLLLNLFNIQSDGGYIVSES